MCCLLAMCLEVKSAMHLRSAVISSSRYFVKPIFEDHDGSNAFLTCWSKTHKFVHKISRHVDFKFRTKCSGVKMGSGVNEEVIALHDMVFKCRKGFMRSHLKIDDSVDD